MWTVAVVATLVGATAGAGAAWLMLRSRTPQAAAHDARPEPPPVEPTVPTQLIAATVVESLRDGVVVLDRSERVVLANAAADAMGVLDDDRLAFPEMNELARTVFDSGTDRRANIDLPIGRLGREPIGLAVFAVALAPEAGRPQHVALLLSDLTELRRLEAVRRDFVANVSHELKTPVGALTLLAEAIQDASDDPEAVARFAARMQREGVRLSRLVRELIDLSRVQGADPMPGSDTVVVSQLLDEAVDRARLAAEQANIDVSVRYVPGLAVSGNEAQLATALGNLIDNAISYSSIGSRVVVTATDAVDEHDRTVVDIVVTDRGIGISEQDLERIFERFYRVDPARSRATGGTGLGLALVKNIVTNHRGRVIVRSVEGEGSTFTIRLPAVHVDAPSSPAEGADVARTEAPA